MDMFLAWTNSAVFLVLSGIHVYWLLGGRWALDVAVPTDRNGRYLFRPSMMATLVVAMGLFGFAIVNLAFVGSLSLGVDNRWIQYAIVAIAVVFVLRTIGDFRYMGLAKRYTGSPFAKRDSRLYVPLSLLLALSHLTLAFIDR